MGSGDMMVEAIAFDADGTLYPDYRMYLRSIPFFLRHARLVRSFSRVRRRIRTIRPIEDFRALQAELLAKELGIGTDLAGELIDRHIYGTWQGLLNGIAAFPHLRELLAELRSEGYRLAVLSDLPVEQKLVHLGLDGLWDCAFSCEETGYLKPNPEPFLVLAERLGLPPERILYVGNNYRYDVIGATEVGMKSAHLSRRRRSGSRADVTFADYRELKRLLLEGTSFVT